MSANSEQRGGCWRSAAPGGGRAGHHGGAPARSFFLLQQKISFSLNLEQETRENTGVKETDGAALGRYVQIKRLQPREPISDNQTAR